MWPAPWIVIQSRRSPHGWARWHLRRFYSVDNPFDSREAALFMILAILVAVSALITLLLVFRPVLQESYLSLGRVREWRAQHRLLDAAYSSGTLGAAECASQGATLGEDL